MQNPRAVGEDKSRQRCIAPDASPWAGRPPGITDPDAATGRLERMIEVERERDTQVVKVTAWSSEAEEAAAIANGFPQINPASLRNPLAQAASASFRL